MNRGGLAICALAGWVAAAAACAEPAEPVPLIDFSVLTPAMEGKYHVAANVDFTSLIPPYLALSQFGSGARSDRLRALVARERYRPERRIADRLVTELEQASYRAVYEPMRRKPAGSAQSLTWDELPAHPVGELMLDMTIRWICLCADVAFTKYYPAISLSWRLLDPGRAVIQPTTMLTYHHFPEWYRKKKARPSEKSGEEPPPKYPVEQVTEACGYDSVKEAEKDPAALWDCFDEAYGAALRRLVIDLSELRPPLAPD